MKIVSRKGGSKDVLDSPLFQKGGFPTDPLITLLHIRAMDRTLSPGWDMLLIYILPELYNTKSKKFYDCQICFKNRWFIQQKITFWQPTLDGCQISDLFVVYQRFFVIYNRLFVACLAIQLLLPNKRFFGDFGN